jgi:hypothetical protein
MATNPSPYNYQPNMSSYIQPPIDYQIPSYNQLPPPPPQYTDYNAAPQPQYINYNNTMTPSPYATAPTTQQYIPQTPPSTVASASSSSRNAPTQPKVEEKDLLNLLAKMTRPNVKIDEIGFGEMGL